MSLTGEEYVPPEEVHAAASPGLPGCPLAPSSRDELGEDAGAGHRTGHAMGPPMTVLHILRRVARADRPIVAVDVGCNKGEWAREVDAMWNLGAWQQFFHGRADALRDVRANAFYGGRSPRISARPLSSPPIIKPAHPPARWPARPPARPAT